MKLFEFDIANNMRLYHRLYAKGIRGLVNFHHGPRQGYTNFSLWEPLYIWNGNKEFIKVKDGDPPIIKNNSPIIVSSTISMDMMRDNEEDIIKYYSEKLVDHLAHEEKEILNALIALTGDDCDIYAIEIYEPEIQILTSTTFRRTIQIFESLVVLKSKPKIGGASLYGETYMGF